MIHILIEENSGTCSTLMHLYIYKHVRPVRVCVCVCVRARTNCSFAQLDVAFGPVKILVRFFFQAK